MRNISYKHDINKIFFTININKIKTLILKALKKKWKINLLKMKTKGLLNQLIY